jgi:hypothetical protein
MAKFAVMVLVDGSARWFHGRNISDFKDGVWEAEDREDAEHMARAIREDFKLEAQAFKLAHAGVHAALSALPLDSPRIHVVDGDQHPPGSGDWFGRY